MKTTIPRSGIGLLGALLVAVMAAGCAEERAPINRVQPYALKKSFFVGEDLLDGSDDPEFYFHTTIIDVGYGAYSGLFTSTWAQPIARIKWVIDEDSLIGRLTYERIQNSDGKGGDRQPDEGIIAIRFRIKKHFDIKRAYNSTTGEELNIIEENTTDRPWYEREYFRVDWSQNLATNSYDFDPFTLMGLVEPIQFVPHPYDVEDPTHEHAPVFALNEGYFDVTTKVFAVPQTFDIPRWGLYNIPSCFLEPTLGGNWPVGNCSPVEVTIRHSFLKVEDRDYEPKHWDGHRFQAFGAFYTERIGYDRQYGMTDNQHYRLINRFNIWERSHYYDDPENMIGPVECFTTPGVDPNRDEDGDGTADECAAVTEKTGVKGSQCDTFNQKCTLPYRLRKVRPNPWYYTVGSDPEYFEPTREALIEWDAAMRFAVQAARYAECQQTGDGTPEEPCSRQYPLPFGQQDENQDLIHLVREVEDCRIGRAYQGEDCDELALRLGRSLGYSGGVITLARMENIFALCHSPVEANDPAICGGPRLPEGMTALDCHEARLNRDRKTLEICSQARQARLGDLRYHKATVIEAPQSPSPWGIMTDANDPVTGEKIAASANVWSYVTEIATQQLVDQLRYAHGELSTEEITEGDYVIDWSEAAKASRRGGILGPMTRDEIDDRLGAVAGVDGATFRELAENIANTPIANEIHEIARQLHEIRAEVGAPSAMAPKYEARLQEAAGTWLEAELTTPAMQQLYGDIKGLEPSLKMALSSPFRGANLGLSREMRHLLEVKLAERGACILNEAPAPVSVAALGDVLQRKFGEFNPEDDKVTQIERARKMQRYLAHKYHYAVMAHEMGHSMGLRHNFVSSSDAYGYRPQYWQLRTKDGRRREACTDLRTPEGCVGPRYFDPIDEEQADQLIQMFMHSSVMDYPGEPAQELIGLGIYDFAAVRMFYADLTSVHTDLQYRKDTRRGRLMEEKLDNFGGILGFRYVVREENNRVLHYSELNRELALIQDCKAIASPSLFKPAAWDEEKLGPWDPLVDGLLVQIDGVYTRCKQQTVDYIPWKNLRLSDNPLLRDRTGPTHDSRNRVRLPYGFATDRWADLGNVAVFRHDNGADPYELFDFLITQQEINHIFDNYRRNRLTFSVRGAISRTMARYNEKLRDAAKGLGLLANVYRDFAQVNGWEFGNVWAYIANNLYPLNSIASSVAFDHFTRMFQRPQPGPHAQWFRDLDESGVVLRSMDDTYLPEDLPTLVTVPNGATGRFGNVHFGGKPIHNALAQDRGEYSTDYTLNAGSYYDKVYTTVLMTESYDNFISSSRSDFIDTRYRAVSMADLYPDGFRRWLANNLTGDEFLKGTRVILPDDHDPAEPPPSGIGWTSWYPAEGPKTCFVGQDNLLCTTDTGPNTFVLESQTGWEQQKFLIAWTMIYLPENAKQQWINMMRLWELGVDTDPQIPATSRIEFHDPEGRTYVARTFGKEVIFGKEVQKGIAARVLEYANELLAKAYEVDEVDADGDGVADWYLPRYRGDGTPIVKFDPGVIWTDPNTGRGAPPPANCSETDNSGCTCEANRYCVALRNYTEVPYFLREVLNFYRLGRPSMKGIY